MLQVVGNNWSLSVEAGKNLSPSCHIDFHSQQLSFCSKAIVPCVLYPKGDLCHECSGCGAAFHW